MRTAFKVNPAGVTTIMAQGSQSTSEIGAALRVRVLTLIAMVLAYTQVSDPECEIYIRQSIFSTGTSQSNILALRSAEREALVLEACRQKPSTGAPCWAKRDLSDQRWKFVTSLLQSGVETDTRMSALDLCHI